MADIIYTFEGGIYFNITNKCPCKCVFCIRDKVNAIGEAKSLFHDVQPTFEDVKRAIDSFGFKGNETVVFCGYGEPTNAYDCLIKSAKYLKEKYPEMYLRLNTNGLSDLINEKPTAEEICSYFDYISISLNAPSSEEYNKITRNIYPEKAYDAVLKFTEDCVKTKKRVRMSVVDVIGEEKVEKSRKIAEKLGAEFICRSFEAGR